jgi:hypothetical protein
MYDKLTAPPQIGSARETELLDFKARVHRFADGSVDQVAIALPIAAFANRVGGAIAYGASEGAGSVLAGFAPLTPEEVAFTIDACDKAIKTRCVPGPLWSPQVIPVEKGCIVAINVDPYASALVAVRVPGDKARGYGGEAYVFPMRVGTHTTHLTPDQIPMFMDPKIRRTLIMLSKINTGEEIIFVTFAAGFRSHKTTQLEKVDADLNIVRTGSGGYPIDRIESVWWNPESRTWIVECRVYT